MLQTSKSNLVRKKCIELIPEMFKCMPDHFKQSSSQGDLLNVAMEAIYDFINKKDNKDRG